MIVTHLGALGDGVAGRIFVPGAAPGDTLIVDAGGAVTNIVPGPNHAAAPCAHFDACGGCSLQHVAMPLYAQWLGERILMALQQHGVKPADMQAPHVSPPGARRRVTLKALRTNGGVVLGFNRKASHLLVDISNCVVADHRINQSLGPLRQLLHRLLKPKQAASVSLTQTASGLDLLIAGISGQTLSEREALIEFAQRQDLARLAIQDAAGIDVILESRKPVIQMDGLSVALPVACFTQATADAEAAMIAAAKLVIKEAKTVADLFCGVGTFALPVSRTAHVHAVEGALAPLQSLEMAARLAQRRVTVEHRDLFRNPLAASELVRFEAVLLDPPRAGADQQCMQLAESKVPVVVAVSCNPNTFARDAARLVQGGYKLQRLWPIGQFLWSTQVELVAEFVRQ